MANKKNDLTIREQAAALLFVYGIETSPARLYAVAHPGSLEAVAALSDVNASASRWLRNKKVQEFVRKEKAALDADRARERMAIEAETLERVDAAKDHTLAMEGMVDYSDPRNQLRKLNSLINGSKDAGETLDALKVMIAKQSELAPEKRTDRAVRVYLPLACGECPLYKQEKTKHNL